MEASLSEILDNLLGMLLLEGSYELEETDDSFSVSIETNDAGRLIGARGESLDALQLLVNQMALKKMNESFKRVVIDVEGWKKQKEEELLESAKNWAEQVKESGKPFELEPLPAWQRRIVHMGVSEIEGVASESIGEGRDRHIVIKLEGKESAESKEIKEEESQVQDEQENAQES